MNNRHRKVVPIKILCIPGIGHALAEDNWFDLWRDEITAILDKDGYIKKYYLEPVVIPFRYRDEIKETSIDTEVYADALAELSFGLSTDVLGHLFRQNNGLNAAEEALKWRAAAIMQWATRTDLRESLKSRFSDALIREQPDIILAYSLGSLIAYDALKDMSKPFLEKRFLVTFGSQLGSPYIRNLYAGRIESLSVRRWFNLYNPHDRVFTSSLYLQEANYTQVAVDFDNRDPLDHTAVSTGQGVIGYINHYATRQMVWPMLVARDKVSPFLRSVRRSLKSGQAFNSPDHRALLIGVDDYEQSQVPSLFGCVNDTYLISQTIQSAGFPPQNIRLLHNHRATKKAILDRVEWLLDDMEPGEFRLLHYSGHGAQLESYGVGETVDRLDECLCPYDFDWTVGKSIMDDTLCGLYSQLHYDANFIVMLDCCHSGGMARNGQSVRGLSAPGDVAHRGLFYQGHGSDTAPGPANYGAWRRKASMASPDLPDHIRVSSKKGHPFEINPQFFGDDTAVGSNEFRNWIGSVGTMRKIGRSPSLRRLDSARYDATRSSLNHYGPYLPVILEACQESEPALEHVQGSVTYGAFTFALCQSLSRHFKLGNTVDFSVLVADCAQIMKELGYPQKPVILCAKNKSSVIIPS